jgi:hypothetical protein
MAMAELYRGPEFEAGKRERRRFTNRGAASVELLAREEDHQFDAA